MAYYKLVSTYILDCLKAAISKIQCALGKPNGIATLDSTGNVPSAQLGNTSSGAVTSLTTTGSSGAATLISKVLNIPVYSSGSSGVTSFNTRTGAVVPSTSDYTFAQIASTPTTISGYGIIDGATLTGTQTLTNKTLTSPILTTPTLGVATATTVNKVTLTAPATGSTLTLADGSTLATSGAFSTTLTATAATTVTLPTTGTLYGTASGSITSAQLATSLTDKTGTGANVFGTSPSITTPTLNGPLYNTTVFTATAQSLSLGTTYWVYNGSAASVLTLPAISGNTGTTFVIKNISSFQITLNVLNTGSERIYTTHGATVYGIQPGEAWTVYNDGTRWDVVATFQQLKYFNRTTVADVAYSTTLVDEYIAYTTLTAARTVTLLTTGLTSGKTYIIKDETGNAGTNNITIAGTIDGVTNKIINSAYGVVRLTYAGGTGWFTF